jgi:signal transduction histidine kinase
MRLRPLTRIAERRHRRAEPSQVSSEARRGLTIRLKLTFWYGSLFLVAGVLLITINFLLVRDSLTPAPGKVRAVVEETFGLRPGALDPPRPGVPRDAQRLPPPVILNDGVPVSVPELLAQAQEELKNEALRQLWIWSLVALAIMTFITFGSAWLLAGRMLRPLHAITSTARRLSGSSLHERIALKGPRDELKDLADTFDDMLGRLDAAFTAQKEFVSNASHELRTPLTIIRTEIDVALADPDLSQAELREMGAAVNEAVSRSEKLIDGLLILASTDQAPVLADLDLAEIARKEIAVASTEAESRGLRLELSLRPAPVKGERVLLERMVANLLENAIRHNLPDGWFSVKTWQRDADAVLEVTNGGAKVPPQEVDRLFERFYRPDRSRSRRTGSFGLGLAIVKSVVTAHAGTVNLEALREGGLHVTIVLPSWLKDGPAVEARTPLDS